MRFVVLKSVPWWRAFLLRLTWGISGRVRHYFRLRSHVWCGYRWTLRRGVLHFAGNRDEVVMPKLVKLYIKNVIIGFGIAAGFVSLLLWFNVMNLWGLVSQSSDGMLAVFLLWFMNGIVFAGVQFAWVIMAIARKEDGPRGGTPVAHFFEPARVKAEAPAGQKRQLNKRG